MTRHKERTLQNLYNVTPVLSQPEAYYSSLSGTFRMRGPIDEADYGSRPNMASLCDKDFPSCSDKSQKVNIRRKSGTCNVCAAPCSSCLHNYQLMMGTKTEKFSGETLTENAVIDPGRRSEVGQNSETSNVVGTNSTSDSFAENVVSRAPLRTSDASEDSAMLLKYDRVKFLEGHDDNLSCISAANDSKMLANGVRIGDETNPPSSFASSCSPVAKSEYTSVYQNSSQHIDKCDVEDGIMQTSRQSKVCRESSDKVPLTSLPTGPSSQNLSMMEIPQKSTVDSFELVKVENTLQASSRKSLSDDKNLMDLEEDLHSIHQGKQLDCSPDQLNSTSLKNVVSDVNFDNPPDGALNSIKKNEDMEVEVHFDGTDDSDMEEQDVKVCDICGDAGREDLLAVCSACPDGAEHTYCMRNMRTEVPEGNWLCEECRMEEETSNQRQDQIGRIDGNEKNNSCGQGSTENIVGFDVEGNITKGYSDMKTRGKRPRDDTEVSSVAKKAAIESIVGSPRNSNSSKTASLSRESSFNNLDRGKMQPVNHSSCAALAVNDVPESAHTALDRRKQTSQGTFLKSHSFNALNSKPKVKPVDQVALRRLKSVKEPASLNLKEAVRSMGKSMSLKSMNSGRPESKVKMISPRETHMQDAKHRKERSSFERKSSFKSERPLINSTVAKPTTSMSNNDKKPGSLGESSSFTHRREPKAAQPDCKSTGLLKSSSLGYRRSSDLPSSSGEFKRPSSYVHSTTGVSSANVIGNCDQKLNQTVSKEDSSSCSGVADRLPCTSEGLRDGFLHPREATCSGDRMKEHSGSRLGQGNSSSNNNNDDDGRVISCKKCKEFGHVAQSCTAPDPGFPSVGPSKFSKGETDNLKVAIEAAMLRRPGVDRKHKADGQSDDSSVFNLNSEIVCQDQSSTSGGKRNVSSAAEVIERHTVPSGVTADSVKHDTCDTSKQAKMLPAEALSSGGESAPILPLGRRSSLGGTSTSAVVPSSLKSLAIPEQECIWQGSFEVFKSGKMLDLRDGIQAYLSACASPKVIEAVNKFDDRIVLNEVPRLSTWPVQFQEFGVTEDNIALFFFARDRESYEKSYKIMLESMMKNDLALKANLSGVELLIFPSNQLPENSQRWNMLFFLWGVFRGKKENCSQHQRESSKQICTPPDIPPAVMSVPENRCSVGPIPKKSQSDDKAPPLKVSSLGKLWSLLSSKVVNGDFHTKAVSVDQLDDRLDSISLSTERSTSAKLCHEKSGTCLEGDADSIFKTDAESRGSLQATRNANGSTKEQILVQLDTSSDRQQSSRHVDKSPIGSNVVASGVSTDEENILDKMNEVKFIINSEKEASSAGNLDNKDLDMKEGNRWLLNRGETLHDLSAVCTGTGRPVTGNNSADLGLEKANGSDEGSNESLVPERFFFPVNPHCVNGTGFTNISMPWKMQSEVDDRLHDKAPDLELALGAEKKALPPFLIRKVEKKMSEEHHRDKAAIKVDDDHSASLSLSLSFPL